MKIAVLAVLALAGISSASGAGFTGLCNTGVTGPCSSPTGNGTGLAPAGNEQNWVGTGFTATIPTNSNIPAPPWLANGPISQWISTDAQAGSGNATFVYSLTFMVGALADLSTAVINGRYASDNGVTGVTLNGVALAGFPLNALNSSPSFTSWTTFNIPNSSNFQIGANTLSWSVANFGGPTGLRVEFFESNVNETPEPSTFLLGGLGLAAAGIVKRRRNRA